MKKIFILLLLISFKNIQAQKFITSGTIEFEVKFNLQKSMEAMLSDNDTWLKDIIASQPKFTTNYYKYSFSGSEAIYKFDRSADQKRPMMWFSNSDEDNIWYNNYKERKFINLKAIDDNYNISGDLKSIQWKLYPNDMTEIAGFNCRRASAILFDSVYVFAYYTDEINISGGPMSLNGLPGMIMGLTIPRLYTSWIATSVSLATPEINQPTKGKKKSETEFKKILTDNANARAKEWKDAAKWLGPMIWRTFL
ncbi:MAG TPA: GLPGLI family protein [Niabella sp.]|nr:GLPGLI family protein [Niabella sp.]HOZ95766.1 GLPGLI family protein [Niabella sp.]HQW13620.1 GLPGLI family protein [Niabella sp.]HQX19014.1 GLPGLI family protein [Niabella sp.]HQX40846.1 GLPGLI family protein [Niabella sp.]